MERDDADPRRDLPAELTSFVGRETEIAMVQRLLSRSRLVTLTGSGGVGKTRIALRVAAEVRGAYADGVCLVELSALRDPELLAYTAAAALGLPEQTAGPTIDVLVEYLRDKHLLLILDTCEHMIDACGMFVDVLHEGAPDLRVLATSRQPLHTAVEHTLPIAPLPVPEPDAEPFGGSYDAVRLFAERAAAAAPGFVLTEANWAAVAAVCRRLDGIPLAIELAVVRLRALSLEQMASLLDDRFRLLTGGPPAAVPRHQTLRTAIGWSHELCAPEERLLWARLSVFAGDFDLAAVEEICASGDLPVQTIFAHLIELVDKSIVIRVEGPLGTRYRLLDSIREYGHDWLAALREEHELRRRHRDYFAAMAERFDEEWLGSGQVRWCRRLQDESPNLRLAMEFSLSEEGEAGAGLAMATALWGYWLCLARFSEARYWLDQALRLVHAPTSLRARALWLSGWFRILQSDYETARPLLEQCRTLAEGIGDQSAIAHADQYLGSIAVFQGDSERGLILYEDALARLRKAGNRDGVMILLFQLGFCYSMAGEIERGIAACDESLALNSHDGERCIRGYALYAKCFGLWMRNEYAQCAELARASLRMRHEIDDLMGVASGMETLGWVAAAQGRHRHGAYLMGAAETLWGKLGTPMFGGVRASHDAAERLAVEALGRREYERVFRSGATSTLDQAVRRAIATEPEMSPDDPHKPAQPSTSGERLRDHYS
ncbi:MAG TPA: LuxR family transcriptional regulator [Streptosporangiaceae bacterium]|nr:LuxR family transcriptional regulator [Streptosporangiaceae bacterium]